MQKYQHDCHNTWTTYAFGFYETLWLLVNLIHLILAANNVAMRDIWLVKNIGKYHMWLWSSRVKILELSRVTKYIHT